MSLSELYRLAKGKHKSVQQAPPTCSAEPASLLGSDIVELVWENGQVVVQGHPNRSRKNTNNNNSSSFEDLPQKSQIKDKVVGEGDNSDLGRLGMMDSMLNDFDIHVPSELEEHDDIVPWLRHQMDEPVQHNYSSDFFTELSGVTASNLMNHITNVTPQERRSVRGFKDSDSHPTSQQNLGGFEQRNSLPTRPKIGQLDQLSSFQSQCSFPSFRSRVSDTNSTSLKNGTQNPVLGDSTQKLYPSSVYPSMKMQAQNSGQQLPSSSVMNFSHFSKHVSVAKSSADTINAKTSTKWPVAEPLDGKDKGSVLTGMKQADPSQVASISGQQRAIEFQSQPAVLSTGGGCKLSKLNPLSPNVTRQDSRTIDISPKQAVLPDGNVARRNAEKTVEPVGAPSVCSGNSVDRASNDPTYGLKRKRNDSDDSEYPSEDAEEESVAIKKAANNRVGSGSKRSRAAEVHNLSERRRRDRINEKMRALQELIPNCNKADKASMLDEAIEYLKTLQLQVQMMSIGSGLCMPQMMLPNAAHMPRFSPMNAGMGMGIGTGYGLGMFDMNVNPSNCHLVQMPSVYQMPPVPGMGNNMNVSPLPNLPMFGFQGHGVPMPAPCPTAISCPVGPPSRPVVNLNTSNSALPVGKSVSAQTCPGTEPVQNVMLEELPKHDSTFSPGMITNQASSDVPDKPVTLPKDGKSPSDAEGNGRGLNQS